MTVSSTHADELAYGPTLRLHRITADVVHVAVSNIGFGETTANNDGKFIDLIGGRSGGEWCAAFAGYCHRQANRREGKAWPEWTLRNGKPELGAKRLTKNLGAVGRLFLDPQEARGGDLICWHRKTGPISWQGHVGIVELVDEDGLVHTIEGNVGRYPSKVKRFIHDVSKERLYSFASLWREKP